MSRARELDQNNMQPQIFTASDLRDFARTSETKKILASLMDTVRTTPTATHVAKIGADRPSAVVIAELRKGGFVVTVGEHETTISWAETQKEPA